jgi:hypothetical protein
MFCGRIHAYSAVLDKIRHALAETTDLAQIGWLAAFGNWLGSGPGSVIERASPEPCLELFGNKATRGWTVLMP